MNKLIIRGHGSPNSYGSMTPKCVAELLFEAGLFMCGKIDMTGCNLGIGPNIKQEDIPHRNAEFVGMNSFAQRFQLELFNLFRYKIGHQSTYIVHARTSSMTVDDEGRKKIELQNGNYKNKALRDKIIFEIDSYGNQKMKYFRDYIATNNWMCSDCRNPNCFDSLACYYCGDSLF